MGPHQFLAIFQVDQPHRDAARHFGVIVRDDGEIDEVKRRLQARGIEDVMAMRKAGHPGPSRVPRSRLDATTTGFVLEVEEQWEQDGGSWYCR